MSAANAAPEAAKEKKPIFETVVISTPVVLTVVATFILGRSSAEMTQAQYQRSLAGQNQSKVADQWAFFQAKRIRGTSYETTAIALLAQKADPFTADTLVETAAGLIREIEPGKTPELDALAKKARESLQKINAVLHPSPADDKLTEAKVKEALDALNEYPTPKLETADADGIEPGQRKLLDEVLADIRRFKPEKEIAPKTLTLKPETIDAAIEQAKTRAAQVARHGKQIDAVLEQFDALVDRQTVLCREYQRIVGGMIKAGGDAKLERSRERARTMSAQLLGDYKAARFAFDARRYEDDARSNQELAYLYDAQVLQSSAQSDKHLKRSFGFMIAMLIAQVGVTIGSLALMLKFRMPVWSVAVLSGLCAIGLGVYIFFEWWGPLF